MPEQYRLSFLPYTQVELTCELCGIRFECGKWESARRRYCTPACAGAARRTRLQRTCPHCGAMFETAPARIASGKGQYCSKRCFDAVQRNLPIEERFWPRVDKSGDCWLWTGFQIAKGYGKLYRHFPVPVLAHRLAWELATGETLTAADAICHTCDVTHCVRNDGEGTYDVDGVAYPRWGHLFKATVSVNNADMKAKERHAAGDRNGSHLHPETLRRGSTIPWSKLTEDQVREIRRRYAAGGITQTELGRQYGVHNVTISEIVLRKKWRHVK